MAQPAMSIDPVQSTVLLAFLSFVVKFMFDVKAMMKEKNEEREKALLEARQQHTEELRMIREALEVYAEKITLMEERTQWMIRRDRPPTPDTGYSTGERRRLQRDSEWTPVKGVPIMKETRRGHSDDDDTR